MQLSIITINLNDSEGLKKTIESVINQTFKNFEFIIIDGGSEDNSINVIQAFRQNVNYWISEIDNGIFHAMNKGILKATGEFLLFLNSGDILVDNKILEKVIPNIETDNDIVYCNCYINMGNKLSNHILPEEISIPFLITSSLAHQATFINKKVFYEIGLYSENNQFCSDWEFFLKAYLAKKYKFKHVLLFTTIFNTYGKTWNAENDKMLCEERNRINKNYFNPELIDLTYNYLDLKKKYDLIVNSKFYKFFKLIYNNKFYRFIKYH